MQTANRAARGRAPRPLVEVPLAFDFFATDAVCFIPVQFSQMHASALESNSCDALHFPPTALPIQPPKALEISNASADGDHLAVGDLAQDFEIQHAAILAR